MWAPKILSYQRASAEFFETTNPIVEMPAFVADSFEPDVVYYHRPDRDLVIIRENPEYPFRGCTFRTVVDVLRRWKLGADRMKLSNEGRSLGEAHGEAIGTGEQKRFEFVQLDVSNKTWVSDVSSERSLECAHTIEWIGDPWHGLFPREISRYPVQVNHRGEARVGILIFSRPPKKIAS
jgi:hypothetical protein